MFTNTSRDDIVNQVSTAYLFQYQYDEHYEYEHYCCYFYYCYYYICIATTTASAFHHHYVSDS